MKINLRMPINGRRIALISCVLILLIALLIYLLIPALKPNQFPGLEKIIAGISTDTPKAVRLESQPEWQDGYTKIAAADGLSLLFNKEESIFQFVSETGKTWSSGYPIESFKDLIPRNKRVMTTLLSLSYRDASGNEESVNNTEEDVETSYLLLKNGLELFFTFPRLSLSVSLQIWLADGGFYACVPDDGLKEDETICSVVSVDVFPAFGSMMSGTDGYIVYPDGCGALYDCTSTIAKAETISQYVYAEQLTVPSERDNNTKILSPWFGSCETGKQGFAGYVAGGSQSARITLSAGTQVLPLNRIFTSAVYRYPITMSNSTDKEFTVLSDREPEMNYTVRYSLLEEEKADYSGIAVELRRIMENLNILPQKIMSPGIPLALEILMGVKQNSIVGQTDLVMTSWDQAEQMLARLKQSDIDEIYTCLSGWQREGYGIYPAGTRFSSALGTSAEMKRLMNVSNNKVLLQTDYQGAEGGEFNRSRDVVYNKMSIAITDSLESRYLLNPLTAYSRLQRDLEDYQKTGAFGLAFNSLSDALPADASKNRAVSSGQVKNVYSAMLKLSSGHFFVGAQTGNDYLLKYSNYIYNLPDSSSGSLFFTRDIPMIQMILHGTLPYSGSVPGNLSSDFAEQRLKWIEYGCLPYFLVTHRNTGDLKNTDVNNLFNTRFSDWEQTIADTAKDFSARMSSVAASKILRHTVLSEGLVRVDYDNGAIVYINYTDKNAEVSETSIIVPQKDYLVVTGGTN